MSITIGSLATPAVSNNFAAASAAARLSDPAEVVLITQVDTSTSSPTAPTVFSQNVDQFNTLVGTIGDTSGNYSYDERLKAYSSLMEMGVSGKLRGMGVENSKLFDSATSESDIAKRAIHLQQTEWQILDTAHASGQSPAAAQLKFFAELSSDDQKVQFTVTANSFELSGNRRYASIDLYRDQLVANAVFDIGNNYDDPNGVSQALKFLDAKQAGSSWGTVALSLLASNSFSIPSASAANRASKVPDKSKLPLSYEPGNLLSLLA